MVCTRARHRKEAQQNINQVKRFLGEEPQEELDERDEDSHSRADSPSPERDSKDPDWNPYGGITKRRPERKRKPAAKKSPAKKSKKPRKTENTDEYKAPSKRRKKTFPPQDNEDVESTHTTRAPSKSMKLSDIPLSNETIQPPAQEPSALDRKFKAKSSISFADAINTTEKTPSVLESSAKERKAKKKQKKTKSSRAREKAEADKKQLSKKKKVAPCTKYS